MSSKQNVFEINLDLPDEQLLELSNKLSGTIARRNEVCEELF